MAALYELIDEIKNFNLIVLEDTGEIANLEELEALELARDEKAENIALWIKNLKAEAEAVKTEAKKLTDRAKAADNKAERLKDYLTECLGGDKFSTPRVAVSYRKSKAVNITEPLKIPDKFVTTEEVSHFDKAAIKKAFDAGEEVPGAEIEERTNTLIK